MSKVSFRARQIDFNKPLPIVKNATDLFSEFSENALVNRGVPQIPSGMEKEEENEHHFVEVIHALQLREGTDVKIPVPDIVDKSDFCDEVYPKDFPLPRQFVHIRSVVLSEEDPPDYDMDTEDEEWLESSKLEVKPERFESMIDRLERGCGHRVMNLEEAKCLLQDDPSLVIAVYDYWLNKRVHYRHPLLYSVRQEKRDNSSNVDPYVAFRRRSEKMQTRKNRKNDEQSYEKMLMLREQMKNLGEILSRLVRRESVKESLLHCDRRIFDLRYRLNDWDRSQLSEAESNSRKLPRADPAVVQQPSKDHTSKLSNRKRKLTQRALDLSARTHSSEEASDGERGRIIDQMFPFIRTQGCRYLKPRYPFGGGCESDWGNLSDSPHMRYGLTTVPASSNPSRRYTGYVRRRLGRGGRVIYDRLRPPPDIAEYFEYLDDDPRQHFDCSPFSPAMASVHFSRVPLMSKEERLLHRLQVLVMSSHGRRPAYRWPVCTEFSPPSFSPLRHTPWEESAFTASSFPSPAAVSSSDLPAPALKEANQCPLQVESTMPSKLSPPFKEPPHPTHKADPFPDKPKSFDQSDQILFKKSTSITSLPLDGIRKMKSDRSVVPRSHRLWRNFTYGSLQPLESELSRSLDADILIRPNGIGARLLHSSEDRLLLTDPSVLPPPKVCCVARDCVSIDPGVPGS